MFSEYKTDMFSVWAFICLFQIGDALLAYTYGDTPDFVLVELRRGRLRVAVEDGSLGNTTWSGSGRLDDGQWHLLVLSQRGHKQFSVSIDDRLRTTLNIPNYKHRPSKFDVFGPLYVGGLPAHLLQSRRPHGLTDDVNGFVGCLATLTVNGVLSDRTASLPPAAVPGLSLIHIWRCRRRG